MKIQKRVLSLILSLAVLISSVFVIGFNIFAQDALPYWSGAEKAPTQGSGTSDDPYIISTAEEFADIMQNVRGQNVYYKLTEDIYLNDITKIDWSTGKVDNGYTVRSWTPTAFRGHIDGDGHTIYGLYIEKNPSSYVEGNNNGKGVGLLTENWGSATVEFKNLGLDYVYLHGASAVSPFVARQNKGTIKFDSCYVGENVTLKGYNTAAFVAQGGSSTVNITNSYSLVPTENMVSKSKFGGILGDVWTPNTKSISNSFCIGKLYGNNKPTGSNVNLASCYATVLSKSGDNVNILKKSDMQGSAAKANMSALDFKNVFITTDKFPVLRVFQGYSVLCHITNIDTMTYTVMADTTFADLETPRYPGYVFVGFYLDENLTVKATDSDLVYKYGDIYTKWREAPIDASVWNGAESQPKTDADGDGYIDIIYPSELAWVIANDGNNGGKYELLNDIYLNDISVNAENGSYTNNAESEPLEWYVKSDKAFSGEINGNGNIVYGLFYDNAAEKQLAAGLIPSVNKATIKNIGIENAYIIQNSEYRVGAIVGTVQTADEVLIDGCYVGDSVYLKADKKIGGITGGGAPTNKNKTVRVTISNCYSLATIDAANSGGIVGNLWSTYNRYYITGCYTNGRFSEGTTDLGSSTGNYSLQTSGGTRWTTLNLDDMIGAVAKNKMTDLDFNNVYMTTFGYPQLRSFYDYVLEYQINSSEKVNIGVSKDTKFADLDKPARLGYTFAGFYMDPEFTVKADDNSLVKDYTVVYAKLEQITSGDTVYNNYDQEGATFTKIEQDDKRDYQVEGNFNATTSNFTATTEKGQFTQYDAWVDPGVGYNGTNGLKVIRARGYEWQWQTAVMLYDFDGSSFVPETNSYYRISLKYKLNSLASGKELKLRLREKANGKVNAVYSDIFEYGLINQKRIDSSCVSGAWVATEFKFATDESVEALYLAITTENKKYWAEELEFYIDDIVIEKITKEEMYKAYSSPDSTNTYDEKDVIFTKIEQTDKRDYQVEGKFLATKSSMGVGTENGRLTQFDAFVEKGTGVGGGNAVKVIRAQGYEKQWPTAIMLYDNNHNKFTPKANSFYQITLKYKLSSLKIGKQIELRLRQEVDGKVNVKYEKVVDYGRVNEDIINYHDVSDKWVETTFKFRTGAEVAPLFLAITTENKKWWAEELELYIDDIEIKEISYDDMGFDEGVKGRVWSGKIAMEYAGGSGTENDPYLIETPEQLAKCVKDSAEELTYYKITADLKLNDTSSTDWTKNAKSWLIDKEGNIVFSGHLNGDGHIISGLYYNATDGSVKWAALFPHLARNAYIEKLGIVNSSIVALNGTEETYAAPFGAFVNSANSFEGTTEPKLSQCFADDTVYVEGCYAGGLLCGIAGKAPVTLENCYFTGTLTGISHTGSLLGNDWTDADKFSTIKNCYASTPDRDHIVSNKGIKYTNYENVYSDSTVDSPRPVGVEYSILKFMQGDEAKNLMVGFDFENIWKTVNGGTPVLRVFESDDYSSTRESEDVTISFITNGGTKCDAIRGQARSQMPKLPEPTRYGYKFVGWYHFYDLNLKCEHTTFPDFDTVLYAKWIATGFEVDFEDSYDPKYDYNSSVIHHKPGASGYLPTYNRNGMKSMHCMSNAEEAPTFLLSYENVLDAGKEYEITIRLKSDSSKALSGNVELLFSKHPDISAELTDTGEVVKFKDVNSTTWKEYKATFVAENEYIFIRTPKNMSLYFDDVQVVPTGNKGKLSTMSEEILNAETIIIVCAVIAGVLLLGGIVTITIFTTKKHRKAK